MAIVRTALDPRVERNRVAILSSALTILLDEGFDALTQDRVAAHSGVGRSTVYRHWPDRLTLVVDTIESFAVELHGESTGDLVADLRAELQRFRVLLSHIGNGRTLAAFAHHAFSQPPGSPVNRLHSTHTVPIREALQRGIQAGALQSDTDVDQAVTQLYGPICYQLMFSGEPLTPEFVDKVVDQFIAATTGK